MIFPFTTQFIEDFPLICSIAGGYTNLTGRQASGSACQGAPVDVPQASPEVQRVHSWCTKPAIGSEALMEISWSSIFNVVGKLCWYCNSLTPHSHGHNHSSLAPPNHCMDGHGSYLQRKPVICYRDPSASAPHQLSSLSLRGPHTFHHQALDRKSFRIPDIPELSSSSSTVQLEACRIEASCSPTQSHYPII